jgi:hypothetical protein
VETEATYILLTATPDGADSFEILRGLSALSERLCKEGNQVLEIHRLERLRREEVTNIPEEFWSLT